MLGLASEKKAEINNPKPTFQKSTRNRRKKKSAQKNKAKRLAAKKKREARTDIALSMSCWAENYTRAATWQLKHELAYWKSKAMSLEYENKILFETLRDCVARTKTQNENEVIKTQNDDAMSIQSATESEATTEESNDEVEEEDDNIVVSEEYIEFLRKNAEFRKERDNNRLNKEKTTQDLEPEPVPYKDNQEELQKTYGEDWKRIAALEMANDSKFISDCGDLQAVIWPNIPLRL